MVERRLAVPEIRVQTPPGAKFVITNVRLNYIKSGISMLIKMGAHLFGGLGENPKLILLEWPAKQAKLA